MAPIQVWRPKVKSENDGYFDFMFAEVRFLAGCASGAFQQLHLPFASREAPLSSSTAALHVQPTNALGKGVGYSDSAISKSMRTVEAPGEVATKLGEGLYVASKPPPAQVLPALAAAARFFPQGEARGAHPSPYRKRAQVHRRSLGWLAKRRSLLHGLSAHKPSSAAHRHSCSVAHLSPTALSP